MTTPVEELLRSKGIFFTTSGQDYLTKCFNPDHIDSNPSFRINKHTGICHCFSCGYKTNIFKYYGILTNFASVKLHKLKEKVKALKEVATGIDPIPMSRPVSEAFRNISVVTYRHFGAFTTEAEEKLQGRIIFPITDIRDKTIAYIGRHKHSDSHPKYYVYPEGAATPPFPAKFEEPTRTMILVEGMFDLINMYEKGARNVVCTFGTVKMLGNLTARLLPYKVMGVEKIFLLFDGDSAGQAAAAKTKPFIEEAGFLCEIIEIDEESDPGSFDQLEADQIINYTKEYT